MASVSPDAMELVELLTEEGYAILAGELLAEIGKGLQVDEPSDGSFSSVDLAFSGQPESDANRLPIAEADQLDFALRYIELRLVAPMRLLAEAEKIAGELAASVDGKPQPGDEATQARPIRLIFSPPTDQSSTPFERTEAPGSSAWADQLASALAAIRGDVD